MNRGGCLFISTSKSLEQQVWLPNLIGQFDELLHLLDTECQATGNQVVGWYPLPQPPSEASAWVAKQIQHSQPCPLHVKPVQNEKSNVTKLLQCVLDAAREGSSVFFKHRS